ARSRSRERDRSAEFTAEGQPSLRVNVRSLRKGQLLLAGYLGVILLEGYAWVADPLERQGILYSFPLLLILGSYAAWRLSRYCGPWLDFTAADAAAPSKLWSALALIAI